MAETADSTAEVVPTIRDVLNLRPGTLATTVNGQTPTTEIQTITVTALATAIGLTLTCGTHTLTETQTITPGEMSPPVGI